MNKLKKYIDLLKNGTKTMFKEFFKKETNKKQRANMWTFTRLVAPFINLILTIIAISSGISALFLASAIIAATAATTDFFDGRSARKYNSQSEFGELLDQVTDKVFSGLTGICLVMINPLYIITLIGEGIISSINVYYGLKHKNVKFESSKLGKLKMWPLFLTLGLGFFSQISLTMLKISNIAIVFTFIMQLLTAGNYIAINNSKVKEFKMKQIIESNDEELANSNENKKEKALNNVNKNTRSLSENPKHSEETSKNLERIQHQKGRYKNLRDLASSLRQEQEEPEKLNDFQKIISKEDN